MYCRENILAYYISVGNAKLQACKDVHDEDALSSFCDAKKVRKDMLQHKNTFNGDFDNQSKCKSILHPLLS